MSNFVILTENTKCHVSCYTSTRSIVTVCITHLENQVLHSENTSCYKPKTLRALSTRCNTLCYPPRTLFCYISKTLRVLNTYNTKCHSSCYTCRTSSVTLRVAYGVHQVSHFLLHTYNTKCHTSYYTLTTPCYTVKTQRITLRVTHREHQVSHLEHRVDVQQTHNSGYMIKDAYIS